MNPNFVYTAADTPSVLPTVHTADCSTIISHQVNSISTPNLSVANFYQISQLYLNLLSATLLTKLWLLLLFSSTSYDMSGIHDIKRFLGQDFEMKDFSSLSYFLGLGVSSSSEHYFLIQVKYTFDPSLKLV